MILGNHSLARTLQRLRRSSPPLAVLGVLVSIATLFFITGLMADPRTIGGAPAWLKPTKFGLSIALYAFTVAWMLARIDTRPRWKAWLVRGFGWIAAATLGLELVLIVMQAARGTTSHFNVSTALDAAVWAIMAGAIFTLWTAQLVLVLVMLAERVRPAALAWGVRLGLIVTLVGMAEGMLMTLPTAQQRAGWANGQPVSIVGAHAVGVPDGGEGMPITGWSTTGGDLRVAHFFGLHALQLLPLLGWWASRRRRLRPWARLALVSVVAAGYLGLIAIEAWQAIRGSPPLRPDATIGGALLALSIAVLLALGLVEWLGREGVAGGRRRPAGLQEIRAAHR